jgi:deoxyuridine 5'-triphosphate nucleotidohydrolase
MFYYISPFPLSKGTPKSSCYDIHSAVAVEVPPQSTVAVSTGIFYETDEEGIHLKSRSGLSLKSIIVGAGELDMDYEGEVKVVLHNFSCVPLHVSVGMRIAQLKMKSIPIKVERLIRGSGGFGSTGK